MQLLQSAAGLAARTPFRSGCPLNVFVLTPGGHKKKEKKTYREKLGFFSVVVELNYCNNSKKK
jgi:hypothetical protein